MADKSLDILVKLGVIGKEDVKAVNDLLKEQGERVRKTTEKFGESRREIREVGNELGRLVGIGRLGGLALGGVAAAAFAAAKAGEFLKDTWTEIQEAIKGPIEIGIPDNAPAHISAAATAWNQYAEARAKVITDSNSAESNASRAEKSLTNELKLIHEVLKAEEEKAKAELESQKDSMSPEAYKAAQANLDNIFSEAGTKKDEEYRRKQIASKAMEAENLEIDAKNKTREALGIKAAPANVAANFQKTLDENAAMGESAKKELRERIAMIDRSRNYSAGGDVPEFEGSYGMIQRLAEQAKLYGRYGDISDGSLGAAKTIEEHRLAQAQAAIDIAESYRTRQAEGSEKRKKLMEEAGTESGKAAGLRRDVADESAEEKRQNAADAYVAQLHNQAANKIVAGNAQTAAAVNRVLDATLGVLTDLHTTVRAHEEEIHRLGAEVKNQAAQRFNAP